MQNNIVRATKKYNVDKGYFSDIYEKILNDEAETKFSQLLHGATELIQNRSRDFERVKVCEGVIYRSFAYQTVRDPANSIRRLSELIKYNGIKLRKSSSQKFQDNGNI